MDRQTHGEARQGRLTSTFANDLMHGSLTTWNRMLRDIRSPAPFYDVGPNTPEPLAWGTMHEDQAIANFWEAHPEFVISNPRFCRYHNQADGLRYKHLGDSPDRMLSRHGQESYCAAVEAKCPYVQEIHWRWAQAGVLPDEHKAQCYFHMLVSGVSECWFLSFDPRMESEQWRLFAFHARQSDDPAFTERMERNVDRFLEVLDTGDEFEILPTTATNIRSLFS